MWVRISFTFDDNAARRSTLTTAWRGESAAIVACRPRSRVIPVTTLAALIAAASPKQL
jgi:hypothetical protein